MFLASSETIRTREGDACTALVKQTLATNPRYTEIGVAEISGAISCDAPRRPTAGTIAGNSYFLSTLRAHDFTVGEFQVTGLGAPAFTLAYPIMEGDGAQGIVFATLRLAWLAERFAEIDIPVTGEIVLLDASGTILLRDPDATDWSGKNIERTALGTAMLSKFRGTGELAGVDGTPRSYEFDSPRLSNRGLIVAVGIPAE
jgi:hypothetical protein